uniref:NADH:quinone oxidoreductase/Mrp antiporter transmembrane domain-containing protein n=2 Tax=Ignisphaera aggregans TaxID=334771 RepID=A0A7C5THH2_9CREN
MAFLLGFLPIYLIGISISMPLISFKVKDRRVYGIFSIAASLVAFIASLYIFFLAIERNIIIYRFGGFPPPLGIVYIVDVVNAFLGSLSMFMLFLTSIYSIWMITSRWLYLYYTLLFLMGAGSIGCLYTGDIFNFFVSLELLAISSYALTAFYRDNPRAIRAALRYAISGTIATSLYILSTFIIYGAFGTLNMADIALKARNPEAITPFTGIVFGEIVISSKVALSLMIWVFLFKSAIFPLNFAWQPYAYSEAPTPIAAAFTAIADTVGLYGLIRILYTVFGYDSVLSDFRVSILGILQIIAIISASIGALLMCIQRDVKRFIAYSTMVQLSFALLGISIGNPEGVAAAMLHILSNSIGDAILFYLAGLAIAECGRELKCLAVLRSRKMLVIVFSGAILNLFGIIPIFIGFWSKAFLVLSCIKSNMVLYAILILIISGITAIGYFRTLYRLIASKNIVLRHDPRIKNIAISYITASSLFILSISLGIAFILYRPLIDFAIDMGFKALNNYNIYIATTLTTINR